MNILKALLLMAGGVLATLGLASAAAFVAMWWDERKRGWR
jgi:hypothetical protein